MALSAEQLEERRAYIGGTDAAALAGVNPPGWAQPIDVYLEKVGLAPERGKSRMMSAGTLLEPAVAALFTEATSIKLRRWRRPIRSREYPWAGGHLDRWAEDGGIFEAKWAMRKDGWGPSWSMDLEAVDQPPVQVPLHYAVQVQHYLAVTGREHAWLAVLLGWADFRWYRIARKPETITWLMELEERFWEENVLAGVPPAPDGSESYGRHLRRQYQQDDGLERVATPEQQLLVGKLRLAREAVARAGRYAAELEQLVQDSMGATAKLIGPDFTVSWRQNRPSLKVQWEALALELYRQVLELDAPAQAEQWPKTKKAQAELIRIQAKQMSLATTEPGARPFLATFDSDEEDSSASTT